MLLKDYNMKTAISPCNPQSQKINAIAELSEDISEVLPYLNATMRGCFYNHRAKFLTIKSEGRLITLHPREIAITKVKDEGEARKIMEQLKETINRTYEARDTIEPSYETQEKLRAIDLYKLLPGTNCGVCGEATCLAFAIKVVNDGADVMKCSPAFEDDYYRENRKPLLELLYSAGYDTPEIPS